MKLMALLLLLTSLLNFSNIAKSSVTIIPLGKSDKNINDFPFVGKIENKKFYISGSGTVIGDGSFVLTARHVLTNNCSQKGTISDISNFIFEIDDKIFEVEKIYAHEVADLAIIKLKGKADHSAKLSFSTDFIGSEFYGVGFGQSSDKPNINKIEWNIPYGTKRIYKNTISTKSIDIYIIGSSVKVEKSLFFMLKDPCTLGKIGGAISGEGIHGLGDSGGGAFIIEDNELHLFGVITSMTIKFPFIGVITDLSLAKDWISSVVADAYASPKKSIPKEENLHLQLRSDFASGVSFLFDNTEWAFFERKRKKNTARLFR